ncbi:glutamate-1-semialdehyde 2,1-aminomutase [Opitutus terrae]|uniref:Glutamate-1-semialdehyde 2,1-aminomutase n=1 Tax=Opitutus terrae (strain DSM 11246 / JCM 15787 / PB90-1) TaxID=452637 RepID=GSA_OPITP|nr:glutamate-1-semialdehyde 2,1-aminomutase [Opitutus terrae]B1ZVF7.1 RecName: Full=Glutamate-1-semialdehyde 2,1-aminomutase; Short=GSA; AltName: Full=Glutamate-1-semialdehyde aminotransferase; Short=GSA-AT [Opitutus terrae PB90-1]ACB76824.1 glutamate-1-semialdehyde-2,1-aminomutase [Opitutus terrae PB90-1]
MSVSDSLFERAKQLMPGGVNSPVRAFRSVGGAPFFVKAARGATLVTADDQELIDFVCTWGPAIHGHNHPRIKAAIAEALEHGTSFGTPNPYEVEMAELIVRFFPSIQKVRMCNSGTEATMSAIRLARGFTKRSKIIKFAGCYHGHSDSLLIKAGSGALTHGHPDSAGVPISFAQETVVVTYNDRAALEAAFAANVGQIACVIIEPYCGNVGFIMPDAGYLQAVRELCTREGAVLIFDEVMTGFRQARGGVQELENITPDLTCLGKIIGGGLPVGAFGGRTYLMDLLAPLGPVYQAGTLSGNPLAMAAGIAALKLLDEENPYARLDQLGRQLRDAVLAAAKTKGLPVQVPQRGSMFSIFFTPQPVRDYASALAGDAKLFGRFFHTCLANGVYLAPSAYEAAFLSTAHEGAAIDRACEVLASAINEL